MKIEINIRGRIFRRIIVWFCFATRGRLLRDRSLSRSQNGREAVAYNANKVEWWKPSHGTSIRLAITMIETQSIVFVCTLFFVLFVTIDASYSHYGNDCLLDCTHRCSIASVSRFIGYIYLLIIVVDVCILRNWSGCCVLRHNTKAHDCRYRFILSAAYY